MTNDPVARLLGRVAAGDRAAFRDLFTTAASKAVGVTFPLTGTRREADDALQDLYTQVWLRTRPDAAKDAAQHTGPDGRQRGRERNVAAGAARRSADWFVTLEPDRLATVDSAFARGFSARAVAARQGVPLTTMRTWLWRRLLKPTEYMEK